MMLDMDTLHYYYYYYTQICQKLTQFMKLYLVQETLGAVLQTSSESLERNAREMVSVWKLRLDWIMILLGVKSTPLEK